MAMKYDTNGSTLKINEPRMNSAQSPPASLKANRRKDLGAAGSRFVNP